MVAEDWGPRKVMAPSLSIQALTALILFWAHDAWVFISSPRHSDWGSARSGPDIWRSIAGILVTGAVAGDD